jgi:hypothetical protein
MGRHQAAQVGVGEEMIEAFLTFVGVILGAVPSWLISRFYYRRSTIEVPEWARQLVESLPDHPISTERLTELYHAALERGELHPDPYSGYVACPKCGEPSEQFKGYEATDYEHDRIYRGVQCGACGHEVAGGEI